MLHCSAFASSVNLTIRSKAGIGSLNACPPEDYRSKVEFGLRGRLALAHNLGMLANGCRTNKNQNQMRRAWSTPLVKA